MLDIEVIFALNAEQVWQKQIQLPRGATLEQALVKSGFYETQDAQWHEAPCGVYGIQRPRDYPLKHGDQVEVYRPLVFDPMESRRRRAAHRARQQKAQNIKK